MNNIEELKAAATVMRLSSTMRITDEIITFRRLFTPDCALALITQLEAAQKERDVYANLASDVGDIITLLQNNEWAEHVGKTNVGGLLEYQITQLVNSIADINTKLLAAEAALSAANEKVSKPVVLPRMHVGFDGVSTNAGDSVRNKAISDCAEAIRTAGFTADEGKDLWLM
ncbi:TPA: hypothetical protein U5D67_003750 [Yersinia enterocolitica]|nr:hypothetical protein [Yersinia enterocolitica]